MTDPQIFMGFVIGEASGDGCPMIGRQSADVLKKFTLWYRPKVARRSVDEVLSKNRQYTDADIDRHSADGRPTVGRL